MIFRDLLYLLLRTYSNFRTGRGACWGGIVDSGPDHLPSVLSTYKTLDSNSNSNNNNDSTSPLSPLTRVQPPRNNNPATRETTTTASRINNYRVRNLNNSSIPPPWITKLISSNALYIQRQRQKLLSNFIHLPLERSLWELRSIEEMARRRCLPWSEEIPVLQGVVWVEGIYLRQKT